MNVSGTWTNMRKSILVICFSFSAWHEGVRWGEGSTNIVQEDKNVNFVGFYLCFHLGTHFLFFKCHHNSSHETHLPKKDPHGFIFQLTQVCAAHRSHYRLIYFCPLSYSIYGPVPEEKQCDLSHILGASVPSDKSPSARLSTASGCTWGAVVSDYSQVLPVSPLQIQAKS